MTPLSVIIVNYKTPLLVLNCLQTVYEQTPISGLEVFVVDNDSGDNSGKLITSRFPQVRWIDMGYNAGFARANNQAIRQSSGQAVLLLNSDTLVENRAIERCWQNLMASPFVAAGVQLLNSDRTPQVTGNFFMRGGLNYLLPLPYLGSWIKKVANLFGVDPPNVPDATSLVEVDWINGAFLMVKREAFMKAGLFDEDFFLYAEEAEWCSRLREVGKLCIYGQFHVVHLQGASANLTFGSKGKGYYNLYDRKGLQIMLSNFVRIRKQFGVWWFFVQLGFYWLEVPVFALGILLSRLVRRKTYSWEMLRRFCANLGLVTGKTRRIVQNKPYFYKVL